MCTISEIDQSVFNKTALLKRLTGKDLINMEFKYKNPFDEYNYAKIVVATNSLPQTNDKSYGFFRRWLIVDFPNRFAEGEDPILCIPNDELPRVCGKAVKLIPALLNRGYFTNEGDIETRRQKYQEKSSPLSEFIHEYCSEGEGIPCRDFLDTYKEYCRGNNHQEKADIAVGKEMSQLGYKSVSQRINGRPPEKVYPGLKWKSDFEGFEHYFESEF
jgi:putative DNA primase/helicase